MRKTLTGLAAPALLAAMMITAPALAAGQPQTQAAVETAPLKGLIVAHEGATILVRAPAGDTAVTLITETKIRGTTGVLNVRGNDYLPSDLIRGLAVEIKTVPGASGLSATEVTFKEEDLRIARRINAGTAQTDVRVARNTAGVAENADRIDNVGELVAAGRTKVFFASGSSTLSEQGKKDLLAIAEQAKAINGYRLAVVGRADPTGNAAANQRLSEARSRAVSNFLLASAGVLPGRILPATALGESPIAQDPDVPANDAEARRVTVTIAVSGSARPQ